MMKIYNFARAARGHAAAAPPSSDANSRRFMLSPKVARTRLTIPDYPKREPELF
jgi:hypothetical protein